MQPRSLCLFLSSLLLLAACADEATTTSPSSTAADTTSEARKSLTKRTAAAAVFAEDTIREIRLVLAPESLATIDSDPVAEQWTSGMMIMDGDTARDVGIRYKGSEGAWYRCVENGPGGGSKTCPLNMKVKIGHVRDTTFHGLKMFQLHAMNDHASRLVEAVSYWFVRRMGIPAPRTAFCRLFINDKFEGLYLHVEEMDGRFVDAWQPGSDANIYKEVWPLRWDSTATPRSSFLSALQSNKKTGDVSRIDSFARELAGAGDLAAVRKAMESRLDLDEIVAFAAVERALDDDDGAFHWYGFRFEDGQPEAIPHNFFWMEDPARNKLRLLPWDLDKSFSAVADPDSSNAIEILDAWGTTSHGCRTFGIGDYGLAWPQRSAACDKLVAGIASYQDLYREKLREVLDGPFAKVDSFVDAWESRLAPVVDSLPIDNGQGISRASWKTGLSKLRGEIRDARTVVANELAGTP